MQRSYMLPQRAREHLVHLMTRNRALVLGVAFAVCAALASCSSGGGTPAPSRPAVEPPESGGSASADPFGSEGEARHQRKFLGPTDRSTMLDFSVVLRLAHQ